MTDQTMPADKAREIITGMRESMRRAECDGTSPKFMGSMLVYVAALEALLPPPPRPTLADMPMEEWDECQWMQADLNGYGSRVVILNPGWDDGSARVMWMHTRIGVVPHRDITPRPDLPRMEWSGTGQDGEEVTKVDYVSVAGGRTAYGPWTVARLRKKADTAPALPDGWRLADHKEDGRVIVTNTTPNRDGRVYFVAPTGGTMGNACGLCDPEELTYIDQ